MQNIHCEGDIKEMWCDISFICLQLYGDNDMERMRLMLFYVYGSAKIKREMHFLWRPDQQANVQGGAFDEKMPLCAASWLSVRRVSSD